MTIRWFATDTTRCSALCLCRQIQPEVEVSVEARGGGSVTGVMVLLVQETIFTCNLGEDDERAKKEVRWR